MIRPAVTKSAATLALAAFLAGCAADQPYAMTERDATRLAEALGDKVAGEPRDCLNVDQLRNPQVIDEKHIVFRQGRTTWLNQPRMRCPMIDRVGRVLVLEPTVGTQICDGDIAKVLDTSTGTIMAACSFGEFVPYRSAMN